MALNTLNTSLSTEFRIHTASAYVSRTFNITSDVNTEYLCSRMTIPKGTADTTLDLGHLASFDAIIIRASEAVDNIYLSTVAGAHKVASGQDFFAMTGINSATTCHIDCTNSGGDVEIQYMLISNE